MIHGLKVFSDVLLVFEKRLIFFDILFVQSSVIGAEKTKIAAPCNVRVFRAAEPEFIHQKVCGFFADFGVLNFSKIFIGRHGAFIAFFKHSLDVLSLH